MTRPLLVWLSIGSLSALLAGRTAYACGGPEYADLDAPLQPVERHVSELLYGPDPYWEQPAEITEFLHPIRPLSPERYAALDAALDPYAEPPPDEATETAIDAYTAAITAGDLAQMQQAAATVVQRILDLPAPQAERYADALRSPVELLELGAALDRIPSAERTVYFSGGAPRSALLKAAAQVRGLDPAAADALLASAPTHPRAASLRWLSLRHAAARDIPDGWSVEDIGPKIDKHAFAALVASADGWLRDYPDHPLADYVRLKKLRLYYLHGDTADAWNILLDLYTRHPVRAANEMRFLVRQHQRAELDPRTIPPEIAAALLPGPIDAELWSALWSKSTTEPDAPWSRAMQERLLLSLVRAEAPPDLSRYAAFPQQPGAPSENWGKLRLVVLIRAEKAEDARAQAALLPKDDPWTASLRAKLDLMAGDFASAITEPGLDPAAARFLLRILAPDDALKLLTDDDDPMIAFEARLSLATRDLQRRGSYKRGIKWLQPIDADRAALWEEASSLSRKRSPEDMLTYARFLRQSAGRIFLANTHEEVVWYRSLPWFEPGGPLPYTPVLTDAEALERDIYAWLQRSFATYQAFVVYADWLARLDVASLEGPALADAREVLREADTAYNALLNYGSSDAYAWGRTLPRSPEAVTVRRVGKEIRARQR